ncbi:biopolymer transporter ExbD [Jannaschia aquimarina]|uniref:Biopolymer transport protein ExbD/TolR n=1 Tax=Jannaschia aquimarina TaxID=935700 RepID=A0A0D1EPH8_9RHOB|nr:biopolymer transporter ExbD [Jannaschia aquimarina]KIT17565.1 Biopolymer transport protein ExbD/TolR [Jannaschia aquimarina]SNS72718.1 outer membrane transport energization protein ExbD [Jannaschia aquimarina]
MLRRGFRRRALSLTPLVDVIFLLLLFFMLTSTFARFGEIEIGATSGGTGAAPAGDLRFVQLRADDIRLAGRIVTLDELKDQIAGTTTLVSLSDGVEAQTLIDLLGGLRQVPDLTLTVLR